VNNTTNASGILVITTVCSFVLVSLSFVYASSCYTPLAQHSGSPISRSDDSAKEMLSWEDHINSKYSPLVAQSR